MEEAKDLSTEIVVDGLTPQETALMETERAKALQRVQAQFVIAKKFTRDETAALTRIEAACQRPEVAEIALYSFPRADETIEGPSIRLAEVLAQCWGNLDFGIIELDHIEGLAGKSIVESYCMDLETNIRQSRTFTIFHKRKVGRGASSTMRQLNDPRDVYEHVANYGSRRLRACILAVVPRHVQDYAVRIVRDTIKRLESGEGKIERIALSFAKLNVSVEMLERRLGHPLSAITDDELVTLRGIWTSMKDGDTNRDDWFEPSAKAKGGAASELNARIAAPAPTTEPAPKKKKARAKRSKK